MRSWREYIFYLLILSLIIHRLYQNDKEPIVIPETPSIASSEPLEPVIHYVPMYSCSPVVKTVYIQNKQDKSLIENIRQQEEEINNLKQQLANSNKELVEEINKEAIVATQEEQIPLIIEEKRHLIFGTLGYGIKGVDIKTSEDGQSVYGVGEKGPVGGIGYMYKVPEFQIPLTNQKIDNLHIGGSIQGSETQTIIFGLSF